MSHRLKIRLEAEADIAAAAQWYDQREPVLGEEFLRAVDQAIARALENPLAFPIIRRRHEVRRVLTQTVPLSDFLLLGRRYDSCPCRLAWPS
jgi:plasmid stabilization system protein ParE